MSGTYLADTGVHILFIVCLAASLNVLMGYAGQFSMATAAFYAVGAYTFALTSATGITANGTPVIGPGWPFIVGVIFAVIVAGLSGLLVSSAVAQRIKGEYIILLTLAFQYLVNNLVQTANSVTGGTRGMVTPPISFFGHTFVTPYTGGVVMLIVSIIIVGLAWLLGRWGFGRLLRGIREDEEAVYSLGKGTVLKKSIIFGISAAMAGAAGAFAAGYLQFVAPLTYSFDLAVIVAAAVAIGGAGNMIGVVIGAILISSVQPILSNLGLTSVSAVPWQYVILGAVLYIVIRFRPQGLLPERAARRLVWARGKLSSADNRAGQLEPVHAQSNLGQAVPVDRVEQGIADASKLGPEGRMGSLDHKTVADDGAHKPLVRVTGLSKRFGGLEAVSDVSLELRSGEIVALIGPNGAGKTTIFNLLTNVIRPDAGIVELRGTQVRHKSTVDIAKAGMVRSWQHVRIFPNMSVLDNVAIAVPDQASESLLRLFLRPRATMRREREVRRIALEHLEFVGMQDSALTMARDLSFGQQKSVAIARVLATGCDVLLLDEPTSGVDLRSAEEAIMLVKKVAAAGKCVCIVEHSLHVVEALADRVIFLDAGRVIAEGTVKEITSKPELHALYFGRSDQRAESRGE